jgi:hypothetical protein
MQNLINSLLFNILKSIKFLLGKVGVLNTKFRNEERKSSQEHKSEGLPFLTAKNNHNAEILELESSSHDIQISTENSRRFDQIPRQ